MSDTKEPAQGRVLVFLGSGGRMAFAPVGGGHARDCAIARMAASYKITRMAASYKLAKQTWRAQKSPVQDRAFFVW